MSLETENVFARVMEHLDKVVPHGFRQPLSWERCLMVGWMSWRALDGGGARSRGGPASTGTPEIDMLSNSIIHFKET